jgi:hypothetical protein
VKRQLAAVAATALAGAAVLAATPAANATAKAPIRTYHYSLSFNLVGIGGDAGWYRHLSSNWQVVLSPHLAMEETFKDAYFGVGNKLIHEYGTFYLVSGRFYNRKDGARKWTVRKASEAEIRAYEQTANPYNGEAKFDATRGGTRVGPGHYQVTGTPRQVGAFLSFEYGLPVQALIDMSVRLVTIGLWLDGSGRPVKFAVTAHSPRENVNITETFTDYNKPLTIKAP